MIFDTHSHLFDLKSEIASSDFDRYIHSEEHFFLSVSTHLSDWQPTLDLANAHSNIYASIGLHPWFIGLDYQKQLSELESLLSSTVQISALGEIGLDFVDIDITETDKHTQEAVFCRQLELAERFDLPISVHCRKAFNQILNYVKNSKVIGVMHGFSGGAEMAKQFVNAGFKIGIGATLLNQNARRYHETVKAIGLENIVLETDAPNIKFVEPSHQLGKIMEIAQQVALLKKTTIDKVLEVSASNAQVLFVKEDT